MHLFSELYTDHKGLMLHAMWDKLADLIGCAFGKFYKETFFAIGKRRAVNAW